MRYTEDEIYRQLRETMQKLFELDSEKVVADARLYEDLDIDSIDAVNMIIEIKQVTGKPIAAQHFREARTVADVVRIVDQIVNYDA